MTKGSFWMIDLKAELFRKHEEYKKEKLQNASYIKGRILEKKPNLWSKKNTGVLERAQRDLEAKTEEGNSLEKSRKVLAAKAKLYEKMTQGKDIPEEDGSKIYLVDFQKKVIDNVVQKREEIRRKEEEKKAEVEEDSMLQEDVPGPSHPDEEWTEYVDSLGRTRTCMKKDLPGLLKRDQLLNNGKMKPTSAPAEPQLMSSDMRRELERQQWEKDELEALDQPAGPVHYSNVQFNEVRNHGVGYYQFSKEESTRQEEMETLKDLRDQTKDQRARRERQKEKRKALLDSRLAKVKQRKQMREGGAVFAQASLQDENKEASSAEVTEGEDVVGPKLQEKATEASTKEKEIETILQNLRKENETTNTVREWDVGKTEYLARTWEDRKQKLEDDRPTDFAPPQIYYDDMARDERKSESRKKIQMLGKRGIYLNAPQSTIKVYTLEEYAEQTNSVGKTDKSFMSKHSGDVGAIPLPEDIQYEPLYQPPNLSNPNLRTAATCDNNVSAYWNNRPAEGYDSVSGVTNLTSASYLAPLPAFDPTIPPPLPIFNPSQPPPGFIPPPPGFIPPVQGITPPTSTQSDDIHIVVNQPHGSYSERTCNLGTVSQTTSFVPFSDSVGGTMRNSAEHFVPGPLTVGPSGSAPKVPIMDMRNIKNKDAPVLASLSQVADPVEGLGGVNSTIPQESSADAIITGAPVRYKTKDVPS